MAKSDLRALLCGLACRGHHRLRLKLLVKLAVSLPVEATMSAAIAVTCLFSVDGCSRPGLKTRMGDGILTATCGKVPVPRERLLRSRTPQDHEAVRLSSAAQFDAVSGADRQRVTGPNPAVPEVDPAVSRSSLTVVPSEVAVRAFDADPNALSGRDCCEHADQRPPSASNAARSGSSPSPLLRALTTPPVAIRTTVDHPVALIPTLVGQICAATAYSPAPPACEAVEWNHRVCSIVQIVMTSGCETATE